MIRHRPQAPTACPYHESWAFSVHKNISSYLNTLVSVYPESLFPAIILDFNVCLAKLRSLKADC